MEDSIQAYTTRLKRALAVSAALHVAFLCGASWWPDHRAIRIGVPRSPIVLNLQPAAPKPAKKLVDTIAPADRPVEPTDNIAEQNSNARDKTVATGDRSAPREVEEADIEQMPKSPSPKQAKAQTALAPQIVSPSEAEQTPPESKPLETVPEESPIECPPPAPPAEPESPEPVQLARAQSAPRDNSIPKKALGKLDGGVKDSGFLSFEAVQHDFAAYMKQVRDRVERDWLATLQLKYPGTSPTEAVLDVAIAPDGTIEHVTIVKMGTSVSYAPLCKEAVEKAGPFPPFPFQLPDMYRTRKLEIRWTFSYM